MKILLTMLSIIALSAPVASNSMLIAKSSNTPLNLASSAIPNKNNNSISVTGTVGTIMNNNSTGSGVTRHSSGFQTIGTIKYSDMNYVNPPKSLDDMIKQGFTNIKFYVRPIVNSSAGNEGWSDTKYSNIEMNINSSRIRNVNSGDGFGSADYLIKASSGEQQEWWWDNNVDSLKREEGWFWHSYDKTTGKSTDNYLYLCAKEVSGGLAFGFVDLTRSGAASSRNGHEGLRLEGSTTLTITQNKNKNYSKQHLLDTFNQPFEFKSYTSSKIDSDITESISDGKQYLSNKDQIKNEFMRRLKASLENDYDSLSKQVNFDTSNVKIDNKSKLASMEITDINGNLVDKGIFPSKLTMNINMSFDQEGLQNKIRNAFQKEFIFDSDTSEMAKNTKEVSVNGKVKSNQQKVLDEVQKRFNTVFPKGVQKDFIKYNVEISDGKENIVKIKFSPSGNWDLINEGIWIREVVMPVKINLTDNYYAMGMKDRVTIIPGKIVDVDSPDNTLIDDTPSFDLNTQTFTYHNSVELEFDATTFKKNVILYVNDKEVPVYEDIFRIELKDQREFNLSGSFKPTIYNVKITEKDESGENTKLEFTIAIDSVEQDFNFKWVGWSPDDNPSNPTYYKQWLMTQPFIEDNGEKKVNPDYRPDINANTGTISTNVFVRDEEKEMKFASDPLDNNGMIINENNNNLADREYGYMAEAMIVNSGFKYTLHPKDADIDIVKLDEKTLEEIPGTKRKYNDSEVYFSNEGLYHYIIHQKNSVVHEGGVDPKEVYPDSIYPQSGSAIHKLVYVSKTEEAFRNDFTNLDFIQQNPNISELTSTVQYKHLKDFLVMNSVSSGEIQKMSYEQIVSLWYQYVTKVVNFNKIPPPVTYTDIDKLKNITTIKGNWQNQDSLRGILNRVVDNWFTSQGFNKLKKNDDYIITMSEGSTRDIDQSDLSGLLVNDNRRIVNSTIFIKSSGSSTNITGTKSFKLINNISFDPNKESIDLGNISFSNRTYNFKYFSPNKFIRWVKNEVIETFNKQLAKTNETYVYGKDYSIGISDSNLDILQSKDDINEFINKPNGELKININSIDSSNLLTGSNSFIVKNNHNIMPPSNSKIDIKNLFPNRNLGHISGQDDELTKEDIWNKIIEVNNIDLTLYDDLKIDEFNFKVSKVIDNNYTVVLSVINSDNYKGNIKFNFDTDLKIPDELKRMDIALLFKANDLGEIEEEGSQYYKLRTKTIWNKIIEVNNIDLTLYDDLKIDEFNFEITKGNDHNYHLIVTAKENNKVYFGKAESNFTTSLKVDTKDETKFNKKSLAWIIPVVVVVGLLIAIVILLIKKRASFNSKKKKFTVDENSTAINSLFRIEEIGNVTPNESNKVTKELIFNKLLELNKEYIPKELSELQINDFWWRFDKKRLQIYLSSNSPKLNGEVMIDFSTRDNAKFDFKNRKSKSK